MARDLLFMSLCPGCSKLTDEHLPFALGSPEGLEKWLKMICAR